MAAQDQGPGSKIQWADDGFPDRPFCSSDLAAEFMELAAACPVLEAFAASGQVPNRDEFQKLARSVFLLQDVANAYPKSRLAELVNQAGDYVVDRAYEYNAAAH